ncbi:MAG: dihydrolipoamide acetyltransferase family protein [Chlamydiota bacterium]
MGEEIKITLPKLGESIVGATIIQFFKKEGERIEQDEALLEVSTDKVNSEIPSPVSGIVKEILVSPNVEVLVGDPLVIVEVDAKEKTEEEFLSPAVIRFAQDQNISKEELLHIPKEGGRLTRKDIEKYVSFKSKPMSEGEKISMSSMRKAVAENMVRSFYSAPHASLLTEIDVSGIVALIQKEKEPFFQKHKAKLSITSFLSYAIAQVVKNYPLLNSSLDGDMIFVKRHVNIGIAVHVEQGLMVPVIHEAEEKSLVEVAKSIFSLVEKGREQKFSMDDLQGGTLTFTNFGMTGVMTGVPIIRFPEVAIIGAGAIQKKVVVLPDSSFGVRSVMMVSLTFDHRVLDGIYGCNFLQDLKGFLETMTWQLEL